MVSVFDIVPEWTFMIFAALFGAAWGSFANVVIARWPLGLSVVRPASHCFSCNTPIRLRHNIPVVSYILLRGRCGHCGATFSPRYAVVELSMSLLSVAVLRMTLLPMLHANPDQLISGIAHYCIWFMFIWALITAAIIDLETYMLPDAISLPGIAIGILVNGLVFNRGWVDESAWIDPVIGAAGSYAAISLLFVHGYKLLTGRTGMGEGDPKFVAMIGAFTGIEGALFALFAGAAQGLIIGAPLALYRKHTGTGPALPLTDEEIEERSEAAETTSAFRLASVPFGPFLALGGIEYYFFGDLFLDAYLESMAVLMAPLIRLFM
jgi:leader peptidase (prepilin peptidase)/N-methyltransferase